MKRKKILEWLGFRYVINRNTGEVHRVKYITDNCCIAAMKSGKYATKWLVKRLMKRNKCYNGCRWCYKEKDTG